MQTNTLPIPKQERAQILDVLRGIAIFGILLNNIYGFSGYGFLTDEMRQQFSTDRADNILNFLQIALVEGKFYSLFSLLFGIGFSIILIRNQQKGINPLKIFYRRLIVLLLMGAAHIYFLWEGDILLLYALIGFILPLFRKCSDKALLTWATILILSTIAIDAIKVLLQWSPGNYLKLIAETIDKKNGLPVDDGWRPYLFKEGSGWAEWRNWQRSAFFYRYQSLLDSNRILKVMGMFLIGFYVGRKMMYANLGQHIALLKKIRFWGLALGLPASVAMVYFEGDDKQVIASALGLLDSFFYAIGVVPLALAYAASLYLFWIKTGGINKLNVFAPVGRMALTNYMMQTIIAISIFYGAGFGLGQKFGLVYLFPIAIGIFILQVIYSNIWLRYFQYGPLEWIWRQLTYGKKLPLKKLNFNNHNKNKMKPLSSLVIMLLLQSSFCIGQKKYANGVEPGAGTWKTFVISSPDLFQPPPPPGKQTTINELKQIIELQKKTDSNVLQEIHYWNAGPPVYRWQKIADNINDTNQYWIRVYAYLNVAIYDATVAAWKAKYKYNRVRPSEASGSIKNLVLLSFSPSYPCEHSVTAGAAATVFGYLFPAKKDSTMG